MRGEADAGNLTAAALAMLEEVAPAIAGDQRFKTLMALAALKMAERERGLARRLKEAESAVLLAGKVNSAFALKESLREGALGLTKEVHSALLADAVVRAAVTKPGVLTAVERASAGL
jgi:hypothetical protein